MRSFTGSNTWKAYCFLFQNILEWDPNTRRNLSEWTYDTLESEMHILVLLLAIINLNFFKIIVSDFLFRIRSTRLSFFEVLNRPSLEITTVKINVNVK